MTARFRQFLIHITLFDLLTYLKASCGVGACINTFNLAGEPIVETPTDAIRTFVSSGLDYLCIGNFLVSKIDSDSVSPYILNFVIAGTGQPSLIPLVSVFHLIWFVWVT